MRSFTPLTINLEPNAWPELDDESFASGMVTHVAVVENATGNGKPSIAIRGKLDDGRDVVIETTWALFYTAAKAIEARYGRAV